MPNPPQPIYLYKILPTAPPSPLPQTLPLSPLDATDGFIHLSTSTQVPSTATRFFSEYQELWVLKIRYVDLDDGDGNGDGGKGQVKWEVAPGGEEKFPHLYGGSGLGRGNVLEVLVFRRDDSEGEGGWGSVLGGLDW